MTVREDIVRVARSYMDTPYRDHGRMPGQGLDCVGLLVCVARELQLVAPDFDVPPYLAQPDGHSLMEWARTYMGAEISKDDLQPGDAIVVKPGIRPQHLALVGNHVWGGLSIIHASNAVQSKKVIETQLRFYPRTLEFVAAFAMPGV